MSGRPQTAIASGALAEAAGQDPAPRTLLEAGFPFAEVSAVAKRDRYCVDHTYAVHKWWARRPPAVIRALLLAAVLPPQTSAEEFWRAFGAKAHPLAGKAIGDPFMGGATTLVEASRLGADVTGVDVDPLAVRIARVELQKLDSERFECAGEALLDELRRRHDSLYPPEGGQLPLHYFWLREATCAQCADPSLIYRNLWLVRDRDRPGAVVRDEGGVAICPQCRGLQRISSERKVLECCGRRWPLDEGTYSRGRFACPSCAHTATNEELEVGRLPLRLVAVEQTLAGQRRSLREPGIADTVALRAAQQGAVPRRLREASLEGVDSGRPASYGFCSVADLFHPRQLRVLGDAFAWIRESEELPAVKDALAVAVSNALGANNVLCGYATDYGRLSALFSAVRAYSAPVLSVELNPLHPSAGRGTLTATIRRVAASAAPAVRRNSIVAPGEAPRPHDFSAHGGGRHAVRCRSAERPLPSEHGPHDLVLTDPPYFDFIPYSDLSLLYRAWLGDDADPLELGGAPIYPVGEDPAEHFSSRLARAFANVRAALKPGAPLVFTFHSPHDRAWKAVEAALRDSGFAVHAVFPLWADGRGGSHGHVGNCEWDLVFVCRDSSLPAPRIQSSIENWERQLDGEELEQSDRTSMEFGLALARRLSK